MPVALRKRNDIENRYKWNLESMFPDLNAWDAARKQVDGALPGLQAFQGQLGSSAAKLLEWFRTLEETHIRAGQLLVYSNMLQDSDTTNQEATALRDKGRGAYARYQAAVSFAEPELLAVPQERIEEFMREEPALEQYRHYLDNLRRREGHVRSPEVEALIATVSDALDTPKITHNLLADADLNYGTVEAEGGEPVEIAAGTINALLRDTDIRVRQEAWEKYADGYLAYKNTFASCISGGVKRDIFNAQSHNYKSSLEAALHTNNVPQQVYENMLETARRKLPVWHRYWSVRRRMLGLDKLHPYDVFAPLTTHDPQIGFQEGVDMICEGMRPLGDDYCEPMRKGLLEERWVDVYPNVGKRAGAYSSGFFGTHPFILMSYTDDLMSVSTLAHELGHSMHSYLTRKNQPVTYSRYSMFVAEVASNFNQALVRDYLLKSNPDPQFQIAVIEEAMYNFHRYFFIMPILARFEREIHEQVERGDALTADGMINLMADLFTEGYGPEVEIDRDRVGITWAQFPTHMYLNFYVYQYSTGISAANALAARVLNEGPQAAEAYKKFLCAGSSLYSLDALKVAGVDMSSPEPIESAFDVLEGFVEKLEKLAL